MSEPATGPVVGDRYEVVRPIGHGTFGHTMLARDRVADRAVAVKRFDSRHDGDIKALELFEREAAVLRSMRHHGIPEVFDLVHAAWDGAPASFLVMEYVEGSSLAELIAEQRQLDPADVLHLFLEMLGILEYLHGRVPPVIHRDIKPANVIVRRDGRPALVDFGSVRRVFRGGDEAGSTIVGTYGYMPYEQYMGQATPSSDLYSLAATFLHLLTGRPPREFMSAEGRIEVPNDLPGDPRLGPVLARLLRPAPNERYASAREVRHALLSSVAPGGGESTAAALVPRATSGTTAFAPAPRPLVGETKALLDRLAPSIRELMDPTSKPADKGGPLDHFWVVFLSAISLGVVPLIYGGMARARRRRLARFLRDGTPAAARIVSVAESKTAFESTMSNVAYEFTADGALRRDVDQILPSVANRWQAGDTIQILYLPDVAYDSVIVSAS